VVRSHAARWLTATLDDSLPETFRAIVQALDNPGTMVHLESQNDPPLPLHSASAAVIEALVHPETPVWTDLNWNSPPADWLHTVCGGSLVTEPCMAAFALVTQPYCMPSLLQFCLSQEERADISTTLLLQVKGLSVQHGQTLTMPGMHRKLRIAPSGLPDQFWSEWENRRLQHTLGMDVLFTCKNAVMAIPGNMSVA
jgi:alpha-D-ribose 1-methylphosphonate 5-triphosphate synthase subunit PhnH